ncbi:MAG TPA: zinc-binding dehydrogenase, partial [Chloroflexi bacterium]|nr:zinc-binding dehydrogenase [Chloroflexota bacterium]
MVDKFELYRKAEEQVPELTWAWQMYGAGVENIGRDGRPEQVPVGEPGPDQLLVRVDAVGMCFSDVKLIKQGGAHPKLYNRDLKKEPTRLGHEAALTVMKVGENLRGKYHPGQRLALQPDIYQNGRSTAYGYTIPGGLIQYHLIGPEVLDADDGAYVIPVEGEIGYAEAALTEPWACVEAAYTQRRRLYPLTGGTMWILGNPGDERAYTFSQGLEAPARIVLTDVPASVAALARESGKEVIVRDGLKPGDYPALSEELTGGQGFDDIVVLDPHSAEAITAAARLIAFRGTFNLVGTRPLDGAPQIDAGRIHYHYTAYLGNASTDIGASYGEARNRAELRPGGVAVFVGAGGPMGQMHVQRAIEQENGPRLLLATEVNPERLQALRESFCGLAERRGKQLVLFNPAEEGPLPEKVRELTGGRGADDVIVCVPVAGLMAEAGTVLAPDGMLVFFAGVPNGTMIPLDLSNVYLHNAQFTGTSGSTLLDQQLVLDKALRRELSPNRSVAAVGGLEAARDGVQAMMEGRYAGKVVIFP